MVLHLISDAEMYDRIRNGCRSKRLALKFTQSELAQRAGLSLRTIKKFELGDSINLMSLMKLMRALGEFNRFENLVPIIEASPREQFLTANAPPSRRPRRAKR